MRGGGGAPANPTASVLPAPKGDALSPSVRPGYAGARLEGCCAMATVTRAGLSDAVQREIGLSLGDAHELVDAMIEAICARLEAGEPVMISSFGTFTVREKGARMGRNPKTGEAVRIAPRRVVAFRASQILKHRVASARQDAVGSGPDSRDDPRAGRGG